MTSIDVAVDGGDDGARTTYNTTANCTVTANLTCSDAIMTSRDDDVTGVPVSCGVDVMPFAISVAGATIGSIILAVGTVGNFLVLAALALYRPLRKSSNLFVASLALCDLFHTTLVRPFYVKTYLDGVWTSGASLCAYALISSNLAILESILHVTAIAFHRYVVLVHPRLAACFQRRAAIVCILALIYLAPLGVVVSQSWLRLTGNLTMDSDVVFNRRIMFCSFVRHSEFRVAGVVKKMSFVIVAAVFIFYCYVRIYHMVRTRGKRLSVHGTFSPNRLRRELTLLKTVVAVFVMFVVNYLPITLTYGLDTRRTLPDVAYFVGVMLLWTSSSVNWIIYGLMNVQYARAYRYLASGGACRRRTTRMMMMTFNGGGGAGGGGLLMDGASMNSCSGRQSLNHVLRHGSDGGQKVYRRVSRARMYSLAAAVKNCETTV